MLLLSGCGHHRRVTPQPPAPQASAPQAGKYPPYSSYPATPQNTPLGRIPITPVPPGGVSAEDLDYVARHAPILTDVRPGHVVYRALQRPQGRQRANLRRPRPDRRPSHAAHGARSSWVTNMKTGQSSAMRITDRGPFVSDRTIDLTIASAKATGVYLPGSAQVRVDVYAAPKPIEVGGRWCVQIGAFKKQHEAVKLKEKLLHNIPEPPSSSSRARTASGCASAPRGTTASKPSPSPTGCARRRAKPISRGWTRAVFPRHR